MNIGFITRTELKRRSVNTASAGLSDDRLHQLGLKAVENMNPAAITRHMKPIGSKRPDIYILGEGPGKQEDEDGKPFVGPSGELLFDRLPQDYDDYEIRINNVVRTLPKRRKNTYKPTHDEIEAYRPSLEQDIAETKPKIIIALGDTATFWCIGQHKNVKISTARGRRFPVKIGGHACWVYACHHPAYILRVLDSEEYEQIPGSEHDKFFEQDICRAFDDLENLDEPIVESLDTIDAGISYETQNSQRIVAFIKRLIARGKPVTIDIETNRWRPYSPGAKILTVAIGHARETLAFPIDHPQAIWSSLDKGLINKWLRRLLIHPDIPKTAHFASFELEWLSWKYGIEVLYESQWHCTGDQAYIIDERKGAFSLNFLCVQHFGLELKKASKGTTASTIFGRAIEGEAEIDRTKLESTRLADVLVYNGRDTKYQDKLYWRQRRTLKDRGLWNAYKAHVNRIPHLVRAQREGILIDQAEVRKNEKELEAKKRAVEKLIETHRTVVSFKKRFGKFNPASHQDCVKYFHNFRGRDEVKRGSGFSTDESILELMPDEPVARMMLDWRKVDKLSGTYVRRMKIDEEDSFVYSDGRLHPVFKYTSTDTKRLSCSDPNGQNWPKRKDMWIRREVIAPEDCWMLCCDQGQLEYRVLGMLSKDKVIVDSIWKGYDVHMDWAIKIARVYPKVVRDRHGDLSDKSMKAFRSELKTDVIFPWFYGASLGLAAHALDNMPRRKLQPIWDEFWHMFKGVHRFQKLMMEFYEEHGYVETPLGDRRHGPMAKNQIINSPVQGTASHIVVWSMENLSTEAFESDRPWLAPVLNVHDDLTFYIPKKHFDESVEIIADRMANVPFDFINVPLAVEMEYGKNWFKKKKLDVFKSNLRRDSVIYN